MKTTVNKVSTKNRIENNLNVETPKLLQNINFRFALVSLTKYQTKTVSNSFVTIAVKTKG